VKKVAKATFFLQDNNMFSFLKKVKNSIGIEMSVVRLEISYNDIVEMLGQPHITKEEYPSLGYINVAHWDVSFLNKNFSIRYNSDDWAKWQYSEVEKKKKWKVPKLEKTTWGNIIGQREISNYILMPILYQIHDQRLLPYKYRGIIDHIFKYDFKE